MNEAEFLFFLSFLWGLVVGALLLGWIPLAVSSGLVVVSLIEWEKRQ